MESKTVGFCAVVAVLGIISAAAGFAAEITKVKASAVFIFDDACIYPSSPAMALGIVSAVFAIMTQAYISVAFGRCRCCQNDPNSTPVSKLLAVLSWVATVIAVVLLLAAAGLNNRRGGEVDSYGYITCYVVKPGIFAAGAILALLSAVFGIAAYISVAPVATQPPAVLVVAVPVGGNNVDPEKGPTPVPFPPPQQFPPQQYPPQQFPHQQYPPRQF